jgi:uncharacterized protein (DUF58 family)
MLPRSLSPDALRKLELLTLRSKRAFLGARQGIHISLKRGHGLEFSDYRKYELGDNPRDIDWGVYARSDRMYVKTFNEEQNLSLYIAIDASYSMRLPEPSIKWEFASSIALGLAYIGLSQQDDVALSVIGGQSFYGVAGPRSFGRLAELYQADLQDNPDMVSSMRQFIGRIRAPGIFIFISDFLYPHESIQELALLIRSRNLDATFIQTLSPFDLDPSAVVGCEVIDGETGELSSISELNKYQQVLDSHQKFIKSCLESCHIRHIVGNANSDPVDFIGSTLHSVGLVG